MNQNTQPDMSSNSSSASSSDEEPLPPRIVRRQQEFGNTHKRRNPDLNQKEFIAYGVDNAIESDEPGQIERFESDSSVFKK